MLIVVLGYNTKPLKEGIIELLTNFERSVEYALKWEGGFTNDPVDPGGATNFGITINTLRDAGIDVDSDGDIDVDDVRALAQNRELVYAIYKNKYWDAINGDNFDLPFALAAFDTAVNCGVSRTNRWIKQSDGDYTKLLNLRMIHYLNIIRKNPALQKFKKGWINRINDLKKTIDIEATTVV